MAAADQDDNTLQATPSTMSDEILAEREYIGILENFIVDVSTRLNKLIDKSAVLQQELCVWGNCVFCGTTLSSRPAANYTERFSRMATRLIARARKIVRKMRKFELRFAFSNTTVCIIVRYLESTLDMLEQVGEHNDQFFHRPFPRWVVRHTTDELNKYLHWLMLRFSVRKQAQLQQMSVRTRVASESSTASTDAGSATEDRASSSQSADQGLSGQFITR